MFILFFSRFEPRTFCLVCEIDSFLSFCWCIPTQLELASNWTELRFNQHLEAVGSDRQVWSFGAELADGVAWCTLLNAIDPAACPPPDDHDPEANAASAVQAVHKMGIKVCVGACGCDRCCCGVFVVVAAERLFFFLRSDYLSD